MTGFEQALLVVGALALLVLIRAGTRGLFKLIDLIYQPLFDE